MSRFRKLAAAAALAGLSGLASAAGYSGLYIVGDSLSDVGNAALVVGANAGQTITGNDYIPDQPYALGQFTNADVWAKTFAAALGQAAGATPSFLGGTNYAFGGARLNLDGQGLAYSLTKQTDLLLADHPVLSASALYVVAGGGNDARDALVNAGIAFVTPGGNPGAVIGQAAADYATNTGNIIDRLQAAGARNIIVWDVPNLALAPAVVLQGGSALGGAVSAAMNQALSARLAIETPGVSLFDLYGLFNSVAASPGSYGLSNVNDACGALANCDPSTTLFWDGIHPTSAGHSIIAQQMLLTAVPEPATWALMAAGVLIIGLRSHKRPLAATWG